MKPALFIALAFLAAILAVFSRGHQDIVGWCAVIVVICFALAAWSFAQPEVWRDE